MIRSLAGKLVSVSISNGQFIIRPLKRAYKEYKESFPKITYDAWANQNEERCFVEGEQHSTPLISIVVPAYNPDRVHFLAMVYSVVNQHYVNWELIIVNASDNEVLQRQINDAVHIDTRIKVIDAPDNQGISRNTNEGLAHAAGEYIAFFDHDDLLHPCALHSVAAAIDITGAELVYTDEDKIKADNSLYFDPFCKPKWSPDLLMNVNYINHLTVIKKEFVDKVGGLRPAYDGAQDYDLLWRVIDECRPNIQHIPRVLYHWRAAATSTAADFSTKTYVLEAGTKLLQEHLERTGLNGTVRAIMGRPGFYETAFVSPEAISLVIGPPEKANYKLCATWLTELLKAIKGFKEVEIVIGEWFEPFEDSLGSMPVKYIKDTKNYWRDAANLCTKKTVLVFALAAIPEEPEAAAKLAGRAKERNAIVAPLMVSQGGNIMDAGLVEAPYGNQPLFREAKRSRSTYYGSAEWVRNVAGLNLNLFAAPHKLFGDLAKNAHGSMLEDSTLQTLLSGDLEVPIIMDAQNPFVFKGSLHAPPLVNTQYFNPQLTKAFAPSIGMRVAAWGDIGDISERENVG